MVAVVAVVGYFASSYPPSSEEAAGTIAPAERYRADQIGSEDVKLGDESLQAFMQTDTFDRLINDQAFLDAMNDAAVRDALNDRAVRDALEKHRRRVEERGDVDEARRLLGALTSRELEVVLDHHPAVYEAAAVGVPPAGGGADSQIALTPRSAITAR